MQFGIDFAAISSSPYAFAWWFFTTIGWIFPVILFIAALVKGWQFYIRNQYRRARSYTLLAIDIPKGNLQTPKAVENIFNHLAGAHQPLNFHHKWWFGEIPDSFSFEVVSIGGYIQFIVHIVEGYRDLLEAIIYAQYPDAEITEIEDYTKPFEKVRFPNNKYDSYSMEIKQAKKQWYPIRVYREFEDPSAEDQYKDSMASILEGMSRIGPGEQLWLQLVVTPADNDWGEPAQKEIDKIIGAKSKAKPDIFSRIIGLVSYVIDSVIASPATTATQSSSDDGPPNQMLYLTPGQQEKVKAIERKTGQLGFHTRIRTIYIAEKSVFDKKKGGLIYGAFKQFNTLDLNSFKPTGRYLTASVVYFKQTRLNFRKRLNLYNYRWRGHWLEPGAYGAILNSEELATLFHFPVETVKAPLLKTTEAKKSEPPISLPTEATEGGIVPVTSVAAKVAPPSELPAESADTESAQPEDATPEATPPTNLPV